MKDFGQMIRTRKALEAWRTAANERTLREPKKQLVDENLTRKKLINLKRAKIKFMYVFSSRLKSLNLIFSKNDQSQKMISISKHYHWVFGS